MVMKRQSNDISASSKRALLRFMEVRKLKAGSLAKRAGFSPSAIYNLEAGRAAAPSAKLLEKIAEAEGVTVADILSHANEQNDLAVTHALIGGARVVPIAGSSKKLSWSRRALVQEKALLCEVASDALHPIPAGWLLLFSSEVEGAASLLGTLSVLNVEGASDPVVGTAREMRKEVEFDVDPWHGATIRNVSIGGARRILAFLPPTHD